MARALKTLHLKGYRAFSDFRLTDLGRVNLIVGKNNAGKTSVLEAIRLLASGGDLATLYQIAIERGESMALDFETSEYRRRTAADISHFFHGHQFGRGSIFEIGSGNGLGTLTAAGGDIANASEEASLTFAADPALFEQQIFDAGLALQLRYTGTNIKRTPTTVAVSDEGGLIFDSAMARRISASRPTGHTASIPTIHITPSSLETSFMAGMWERMIREGREADAIAALKILQPNIEGIFFLPGERALRSQGGVLVGLKDTKQRVPLGSMGEGMRRVLALAISLAQARKGFLLVDEFDTGLHWSVMARMWELTMRSAAELDVQVFATTHSLDCLRGLKDAVENNSKLAASVRVHKVDTALRHAVTFTAKDLAVAIEQEIEVRG